MPSRSSRAQSWLLSTNGNPSGLAASWAFWLRW
jgi:hypothetical protein